MEKILFIRSCSSRNLLTGLAGLKKQFPNGEISVLTDPDILGILSRTCEVNEVIVYRKLRDFLLCQLWELHRRRYDLKAVFWTGEDEGRYNKFKVLAFLLGPRHMLVYNENGDSFALSIRNWQAILNHILWRARASGTTCVSFDGLIRLARGILNVLLLPVAFLLLLLSTGRLLSKRLFWPDAPSRGEKQNSPRNRSRLAGQQEQEHADEDRR